MRADHVDTVSSGEVQLAVFEWRPDPVAEKPIVLLVHGYPDTHTVWGPLAAELVADHRVVAYDVRGAGASTAPGTRAGYRLDLLVDDLLAVLEAIAPVGGADADGPAPPKVHLVAHDWGSIQAWHAVTDRRVQERVASYTSMSGPCLDHVAYWMRAAARSPRCWPKLAGQLLRSWYVGLFHLPGTAPVAWRLGLAKALPRALAGREGAPPTQASDDPRASLADPWPAPTLAADGRRGIELYRANFRDRLLHPEERRTDVPVQVIVPTGDRYVSPALSEELDRWVDQLWRRPVPGRHWLVRTHPEQVALWVRELADDVT